MLVHEAPFVRSQFDASVPCVLQVWSGYARSEEFRAATLRVLSFVQACQREYPHIEFLVDARKLGPLLREDMEWAAREADPKLYAAGMRRIAFVVPESAIGRTSLKTYEKAAEATYASPLVARQFASLEEADTWLRQPLQGVSQT